MIALAVFCISGCIGVEIYCGARLIDILKQCSEERTDARRARFRAKAYKNLNERWTLKKNRQKLWESIQKER
jgi:hypothetical protein